MKTIAVISGGGVAAAASSVVHSSGIPTPMPMWAEVVMSILLAMIIVMLVYSVYIAVKK